MKFISYTGLKLPSITIQCENQKKINSHIATPVTNILSKNTYPWHPHSMKYSPSFAIIYHKGVIFALLNNTKFLSVFYQVLYQSFLLLLYDQGSWLYKNLYMKIGEERKWTWEFSFWNHKNRMNSYVQGSSLYIQFMTH